MLVPLSDRTFFYRPRDERLRFELDEAGMVVRLSWIDRAGRTYPAKKVDAAAAEP